MLRCRLLGGARRFCAHGVERGGGISWRPPAYRLLYELSEFSRVFTRNLEFPIHLHCMCGSACATAAAVAAAVFIFATEIKCN